jgi:hypothetical protein
MATTATKPPGTLAGRLQQQQSCIDEMRASARMRARLMKKIPKPLEFPRGLVEVTTPGPSPSTSSGPSPGSSQIVGEPAHDTGGAVQIERDPL